MCLEWWRVESKLCPWSGGGLSGNFVPGGERLGVESLVSLWLKKKALENVRDNLSD